jgi:hypothetical protein
MHHQWKIRNRFLNVFFLGCTLICFIKKEGEAQNYYNPACFTIHTYNELVIEFRLRPVQLLQPVYSPSQYSNTLAAHNYNPQVVDFPTLRFSINIYKVILKNTCRSYSPHIYILKMLQQQNIWHQSSGDNPTGFIC